MDFPLNLWQGNSFRFLRPLKRENSYYVCCFEFGLVHNVLYWLDSRVLFSLLFSTNGISLDDFLCLSWRTECQEFLLSIGISRKQTRFFLFLVSFIWLTLVLLSSFSLFLLMTTFLSSGINPSQADFQTMQIGFIIGLAQKSFAYVYSRLPRFWAGTENILSLGGSLLGERKINMRNCPIFWLCLSFLFFLLFLLFFRGDASELLLSFFF